MDNITEYIESGIIEMYVLGLTSQDETNDINELANLHIEIRNEIEFITEALQVYSSENTPPLNPSLKVFVLACIDYFERLKKGEVVEVIPQLNENSKIEDYKKWLDREDITLPTNFSEVHAKIIGLTPQITTAILWIERMTAPEIHDKEYEKFLIVEGTCDIIIGDKVHSLVAGDYLSIPLYISHQVKVTSLVPCKVVLQRVAA